MSIKKVRIINPALSVWFVRVPLITVCPVRVVVGGVPLLLSHSLRCQCVAVFVKVKSEFPCGLALHIFYVQCE
jgi:hypothetical protein